MSTGGLFDCSHRFSAKIFLILAPSPDRILAFFFSTFPSIALFFIKSNRYTKTKTSISHRIVSRVFALSEYQKLLSIGRLYSFFVTVRKIALRFDLYRKKNGEMTPALLGVCAPGGNVSFIFTSNCFLPPQQQYCRCSFPSSANRKPSRWACQSPIGGPVLRVQSRTSSTALATSRRVDGTGAQTKQRDGNAEKPALGPPPDRVVFVRRVTGFRFGGRRGRRRRSGTDRAGPPPRSVYTPPELIGRFSGYGSRRVLIRPWQQIKISVSRQDATAQKLPATLNEAAAERRPRWCFGTGWNRSGPSGKLDFSG